MALDEQWGISWLKFRRTYLEQGRDRFYGAWIVNYLEPALRKLKSADGALMYKEGLCPVAEKLQKGLMQLKTNYNDAKSMEAQGLALRKTIEVLS